MPVRVQIDGADPEEIIYWGKLLEWKNRVMDAERLNEGLPEPEWVNIPPVPVELFEALDRAIAAKR